jgi:hypothetical protein
VAPAIRTAAAPDDPREVVILLVSLIVLMTVSALVVRLDERRLDEEQLERAWPETSRDNALIGLAFLASPLLALFGVWFHFFRTRSRALWPPLRWSPKGFLLGIAAVAVVLVVHAAIVLSVAYALGMPLEE